MSSMRLPSGSFTYAKRAPGRTAGAGALHARKDGVQVIHGERPVTVPLGPCRVEGIGEHLRDRTAALDQLNFQSDGSLACS